MTLTKHQRHYRKKKRQATMDFHHATSENGKPSIHSNQKKLCVRVTEESYERLKAASREWGQTLTQSLERIVLLDLPKHSYQMADLPPTTRYLWKDYQERPKRRKTGGTKQLNLWVGSTAWRKIDRHSARDGFSKARVVETLLRERFG